MQHTGREEGLKQAKTLIEEWVMPNSACVQKIHLKIFMKHQTLRFITTWVGTEVVWS